MVKRAKNSPGWHRELVVKPEGVFSSCPHVLPIIWCYLQVLFYFVGNINNLVQIFKIVTLIRDSKIPVAYGQDFLPWLLSIIAWAIDCALGVRPAPWLMGSVGDQLYKYTVPRAARRRNLVSHGGICTFDIHRVNRLFCHNDQPHTLYLCVYNKKWMPPFTEGHSVLGDFTYIIPKVPRNEKNHV